MEIINRQAQKVVAVAYRRWSFTRGSNCKALTGKILVFCIGGRLQELVVHGGSIVSRSLTEKWATKIAWENSRHLATLPLVSPANDVWETSAENPYWWSVTTRIWVVLLNGWIKFPTRTTNQKHYPDLGRDASSAWNFCVRFSDVIWRGNQWQRHQMSAVFSGCGDK